MQLSVRVKIHRERFFVMKLVLDLEAGTISVVGELRSAADLDKLMSNVIDAGHMIFGTEAMDREFFKEDRGGDDEPPRGSVN